MTKYFKYSTLFIVLLLSQLWLGSYTFILLIWSVAGLVITFSEMSKNTFLKLFVIQLLVSLVLYLGFAAKDTMFLSEMMISLGLPTMVTALTFILFNALTAGFVGLFWNSVVRLFVKK